MSVVAVAASRAPDYGSARPSSDNVAISDDHHVSDELERWLADTQQSKTLGGLVDVFGDGSFAIVFVLLMALPALPLPTGGVTHVVEILTMLLALELIVGRRKIWLPQRFKALKLGGPSQAKVIAMLLRRIRWVERYSRPRGQRLLAARVSGSMFGLVVLALTLTAFLSPPFSGLDTLPSVGVIVLALGFLLTDIVLAAAGVAIGALGAVVTIGLGTVVANAIGQLL